LSRSEDMFVTVLSGLVTLTFDLSSSEWGHGSFLPIFSLLRPFFFNLGSGTGQTDGQTDNSHQRMPHPLGMGIVV